MNQISADSGIAADSLRPDTALIAAADLSTERNPEVLQYLQSVLEIVESGDGGLVDAMTTQPSGNIPKLFLPGFRLSAIGLAPDFDAWLQRGQLAAKYRDAQNFLNTTVTLKKALPQGQDAMLLPVAASSQKAVGTSFAIDISANQS